VTIYLSHLGVMLSQLKTTVYIAFSLGLVLNLGMVAGAIARGNVEVETGVTLAKGYYPEIDEESPRGTKPGGARWSEERPQDWPLL
jgi:hypothetical protein